MNDAVVACGEGRGGDEKFGGIAEGGVEEGADGLIGVVGGLFGEVRESLGLYLMIVGVMLMMMAILGQWINLVTIHLTSL